ncbi:MAG: RNA polymerase sigma factor RpoD/SigA [Sandaracinaceae bacterium]
MQTTTTPVTSISRYIRSLGDRPPLEPEVERDLARAWAAGDSDAGRRLVEASLPFVIKVAKGYRRWGIPLEDLVQQGNLGLLRAAKKFDPNKECRLITYANYWIRAEIRDYVVRGYRIVRLGSTATERRAIRAFRRKGAEGPEQLAEMSGMPLARAKKLWPLLTGSSMPLDASRPDGSPTVERMVSSIENPEEVVEREVRLSKVRARLPGLMKQLSERERAIVKSRLLTDEPCTLRELGQQLGICRERVRQLESQAKAKLREGLADCAPDA